MRVHVAVTANPTADWIARQIFEAFPWDTAPRYLIRDRDGAYGEVFKRRVKGMGIRDRPTAPRSPWQNAYVERLIGSIRRECLDHLIIIGEAHLRRVLRAYADYYNRTLTHLSLNKDTPLARPILRDGRIKPAPLPRPLQNFVSPYPAQHLRDAERRDQLTRKRSFRPWNQRGRFHSPRPILAIEGAFPIPSQGPEPDILFRLVGLPVPVVAPAPLGGPDGARVQPEAL